jgi:hypothetical protein
MELQAVALPAEFNHHLHPLTGPSIFIVIPGVFCSLFAIPAAEKSGMPNVQIAIGLREKNSRSREKEI